MDKEQATSETPLVEDRAALRAELFPPSVCYMNAKQDPGHGMKRLNTPLILREDLYALLFVATLRSEIVKDAEERATRNAAAIDAVVEQVNA